jgi:uncharacterized membrane protein
VEAKKHYDRFWEIDFLRGIAIIMMVVYHAAFDLAYFGKLPINLESIFWKYFQITTASLFILLVGVSLALSFFRAEMQHNNTFHRYFKRGILIFLLGMIITVVTRIFVGEGFIIFGILHLIGISIILSYLFLRLTKLNLFIGIIFISIGVILQNYTFNFKSLLWLGFIPENFFTLDYFPLLPWFGVVLIGIFLGKTFYNNYKRTLPIKDNMKNKFVLSTCFLGKYSLLIYFLHQPIILFILFCSGFIIL